MALIFKASLSKLPKWVSEEGYSAHEDPESIANEQHAIQIVDTLKSR